MFDVAPETVTEAEAQRAWPALLHRVARERSRFVAEQDGSPVAAIISVEDLDRLRTFEAERTAHFAVLDRVRTKNQDRNPDEVEGDVAAEIAAMRQERRTHAATARRA
jgi:hypothetical protein